MKSARRPMRIALVLGITAAVGALGGAHMPLADAVADPVGPPPSGAPGDTVTPSHGSAPDVRFATAAFGRSGELRVALALPAEFVDLPLEWGASPGPGASYRWVPVLGTRASASDAAPITADSRLRAPATPGTYELRIDAASGSVRLSELRLIVLVPAERKRGTHLDGYHIGRYPAARGAGERYRPPAGFIRVSPEAAEMRLSRTFRLREFLTHDQQSRWPKYAVVDPLLLDKLELVRDELNATGVEARHMVVMSGFRTPQYNNRGLNAGRASLSRHMYGDAADVWVDNDLDWYMDDLNGDGRRDTGDARVMLRAVERVEARHPDLIGGAGIYRDNGVHGPFIHIDARGTHARW